MPDSQVRFVADTHALWWYLRDPERLSAAASVVFRLVEGGNATLIVPAIVVAELYSLSVKLRQPMAPSTLMDDLASVGGIELSDLGRTQLEWLDRLLEIPEMHDRLIAAEAIVLGAPVVSRDPVLVDSLQIETIW